jgi:regulator of RNase E activity RraA
MTEAVIISGPRKGDIITLDETGVEVVPDELLKALRELNTELKAAVEDMREVRAALRKHDVKEVQNG